MTVQYDYFKNPPRPEDGGEPQLHPRPVVIKTLKTKDLANMISARSSFSSSDLVGILAGLSEELYQGLSQSFNVYIEGLGTFFLSLESRFVDDISEIRGTSIRVKDIHFRPDKQLKHRFKGVRCVRVAKPPKRVSYPQESRFTRICWYIDRYGSINVSTVMRFNHCTHKTAHADLKKMIEEGMIKRVRFGSLYAYTR